MQRKFLIHGETPAKKNSRITLKNGKTIPSSQYRKWHEMAFLELSLQRRGVCFSKPVAIKLAFVHGDLRRRDSDNGTSSIMDTLVDTGILEDDNWQIVRNIEVVNLYEKGNPYCRIEITELENE